MVIKQIHKFIKTTNKVSKPLVVAEPTHSVSEKPKKNKSGKKVNDMTLENIERAEVLAQNLDAEREVKIVKKDKGLIERTESSKIVLTEDNRQVLND